MISVEKCIDERYADPSNRYPLLDSVQAIVADTIYETNNAIETGQKEALNVIAKIKQVYNILDSLKKDMQWLEKQLNFLKDAYENRLQFVEVECLTQVNSLVQHLDILRSEFKKYYDGDQLDQRVNAQQHLYEQAIDLQINYIDIKTRLKNNIANCNNYIDSIPIEAVTEWQRNLNSLLNLL